MLRIFNTGKLLVKNIFVVKKKFSIRTTRVDNPPLYTITETNSLTGDSVARTYTSENKLVETVETVHNGDGTITETTTDPNGYVNTVEYTTAP